MSDTHRNPAPGNQIEVGPEETGQKLFQFLTRRTGLPGGAVMRLIRTGQVRVDGRRAKPYIRLAEGALVRIPPKLAHELAAAKKPVLPSPESGLDILSEEFGVLAVYKPSGLPTHGGTGHDDSLASRLAASRPDAPFAPTPAHRLDKGTSGIILVATSYVALAALQEAFRERTVHKWYMAWVAGAFPSEGRFRLDDMVEKGSEEGKERMRTGVAEGKRARSDVRLLERRGRTSLVEIKLLTGRTHQIRVQLASRGYPILGDAKYGSAAGVPLRLHAWKIELPAGSLPGAPAEHSIVYSRLPEWPAEHAVPAEPASWPASTALSWPC